MKLPPGEGLVLSDRSGTPVIILEPSMDGLPTITLLGGSAGGEICVQIDHGRPRMIFRRPNGKDGLYLSCRGDGEVMVFHDAEGKPAIRIGYDSETDRTLHDLEKARTKRKGTKKAAARKKGGKVSEEPH